MIPSVRPNVALDANGGTSTPYFRATEGGHNHNLHWKLEPYEDYFILLPRVGGS
ncbi:MAG: hypothetical protein F6K10_26305 [Moorea sp. SIO2B7]|nr:hypothetical protein [Moorena sp. SIO2B7]